MREETYDVHSYDMGATVRRNRDARRRVTYELREFHAHAMRTAHVLREPTLHGPRSHVCERKQGLVGNAHLAEHDSVLHLRRDARIHASTWPDVRHLRRGVVRLTHTSGACHARLAHVDVDPRDTRLRERGLPFKPTTWAQCAREETYDGNDLRRASHGYCQLRRVRRHVGTRGHIMHEPVNPARRSAT